MIEIIFTEVAEIERLNKIIKSKEEYIKMLKKALDNRDREIVNLKQRGSDNDIDQLMILKLKLENSTLNGKLSNCHKEFDSLRAERDFYMSKVDKLKKLLSEKEQTLGNLYRTNHKLASELSLVKEQNEDLAETTADFREERDENLKKIQKLETELGIYKLANAGLEKDMVGMQTSIQNEHYANVEAQKNIASLTKTISEQKILIEALIAEKADLVRELAKY